jgi:nucleotide-binding universal stress UspA family protein
MFERILLATDGSDHSREALKYAQALAMRDDAQVIVVHAFRSVSTYLEGETRDNLIARYVAEGRAVAQEAVEELEKVDVDVVAEVLEGPPTNAILRVVEARQPDLIVMGSRGHGEISSLLLGSVSHRVLAHTEVPVLIVKAQKSESG